MDKEIFVQNVRKYCSLRGVKPTVACRESGAGRSLLTNLEQNGSLPSVEKVQKLAVYLGVTTSELLGEKREPARVLEDGLNARQRRLVNLFDAASPALQSAALAVLTSAEVQIKGASRELIIAGVKGQGNEVDIEGINGLGREVVIEGVKGPATRQHKGYTKRRGNGQNKGQVKWRGRGRGGPARGR